MRCVTNVVVNINLLLVLNVKGTNLVVMMPLKSHFQIRNEEEA
jgi:hypothetical protein